MHQIQHGEFVICKVCHLVGRHAAGVCPRENKLCGTYM